MKNIIFFIHYRIFLKGDHHVSISSISSTELTESEEIENHDKIALPAMLKSGLSSDLK